MYLTAQRVLAPSGENNINGFLYEHGAVTWQTPPEPIEGAIGKLVHTFIMVPQGGNKVLSFVDIVASDDVPYAHIRERLCAWLTAQANMPHPHPLPWTGVDGDMRFGLAMITTLAKAWRSEVGHLLRTCQATFDRYILPEEPKP
jgi:hypothetical protein